ncbi:MAG TPA: ABC transporter permease [Pseudobacteroides sp.]|uniref:ABC transporter permease n=1 Tax=Pseudobacteroides sp. TaxID=1968840 RepID=UPI002F924417
MSINHLELAENGMVQNAQLSDTITENQNAHKFSFVVIIPLVMLITNIILHLNLPNNQEMNIRYAYASVLVVSAVVYSILLTISVRLKNLYDKIRHLIPILTAVVGAVEVWDLVTLKLALLALPYFPGPDKVLGVFKEDWSLILKSLFYSLRLMFVAYAIGTTLGLITGISMGWNKTVNYWVMPILKIIGPIPATAWIPIAMVVFPTTFCSSIFLIVLSVWFPVTVMTSSGIGNVRNSYLEVARTLGADSKYLIFKVAIPAAYPMIFIGLFMGMGNSFITLIVAEMLGVKAGLGWYINWAQGWAEYNKVYACLLVIALIFSTLLTLLFKLRDRVLIWQKGLIKW